MGNTTLLMDQAAAAAFMGISVTASDVIDGIATEKGVGIEILPEEEEPAPVAEPA